VIGVHVGADLLSTLVLGMMAAVAALNLATFPRGKRRAPLGGRRVSLLVPARNEVDRIGTLLDAVRGIDAAGLELLVLDDQSEDGTSAMVDRYATDDPRISLLTGADLPPGWLGKNWACHQLALAATTDVMIFCDADVVPTGEAVAATLEQLESGDVATALPRHELRSWAEKAVVPFFTQLPIFWTLPALLVPRTRSESVSFGNGQWLAFRREAYERIGGHVSVAREVLEDVRLARLAKRAGLVVRPFLATESLRIRMYVGWPGVRAGFSKNAWPLLGERRITLAGAIVVAYLSSIHPVLTPLLGGSVAPLLLLLGIRIATAVTLRQPPGSVLLHPLGALLAIGIAILSWRRASTDPVEWRGRRIAVT
jgi:chlorobactene glucosyltransferase